MSIVKGMNNEMNLVFFCEQLAADLSGLLYADF